MQIECFEDLEIWKQARQLTNEIYRLTSEPKFWRDFSLRNQIQSAVVSIMSNIAEGFERSGNQKFVQFLYVAKGSCGEVRSQLYVAVDRGYITKTDLEQLIISFKRLSSMISSLISYLKCSGMKGAKYNHRRVPASSTIQSSPNSY